MAQGQVGEWYWGARCPTCGTMTAHSHDPSRGEDTIKIQGPGTARASLTCPSGHRFDVAVENLLRFEWGAQ